MRWTLRLQELFVGLVTAGLALGQADTPRATAEVAEAVAAFRAGDPRALGLLRQQAATAAETFAAALAEHVQRNAAAEAAQDLEALSTLGVASEAVLGRLRAALDPGSDELRGRILRTIGDLAPLAADPAALEVWVAELPTSGGFRQLSEMWTTHQRRALLSSRIPAAERGEWLVPTAESSRIATRLRHRNARTVAELQDLVLDPDIDAAELAAERLAEHGAAAAEAAPSLLWLMRAGPNLLTNEMRMGKRAAIGDLMHLPTRAPLAAAVALTRIAPADSATARRAHAAILESGRPDQKLASLIALRGADAEATLALVAPLLEGEHHVVLRREALVTLSTLGEAAAVVRPALERIAAGAEVELAKLAQSILRSLQRR